jgi:hypothetical protein
VFAQDSWLPVPAQHCSPVGFSHQKQLAMRLVPSAPPWSLWWFLGPHSRLSRPAHVSEAVFRHSSAAPQLLASAVFLILLGQRLCSSSLGFSSHLLFCIETSPHSGLKVSSFLFPLHVVLHRLYVHHLRCDTGARRDPPLGIAGGDSLIDSPLHLLLSRRCACTVVLRVAHLPLLLRPYRAADFSRLPTQALVLKPHYKQ